MKFSVKVLSLKCLAGVLLTAIVASCAGEKKDLSRPTRDEGVKPMSQRLSETGGYKQDSEGNWVPKSDKRSQFDRERESAYFKGKVETERYKTGDYKKKEWLGSKDFGRTKFAGNTDGSRFQTKARQDGQRLRDGQKSARLAGPFQTNTLDRQLARESSVGGITTGRNESVESARASYKAPSVIDWKEQRGMSINESRGILGR